MIKQNEHLIDRLLRALLASLLFVGGYFWVGGVAQVIIYILALVLAFTAVSGFCGLYGLLNVDTKSNFAKSGNLLAWSLVVLILAVLGASIYASSFFTRKIFVEDFNAMNNNYKQTLFNTGQDKRAESIDNYEKLVISFAQFQEKYKKYKPVVIRSDKNFNTDLESIGNQIKSAKENIYSGDLKALHYELEPIRLAFQGILKRNNFSMLGMALSDFHDAMEVAVEAADVKNQKAVIEAYPENDTRLKLVEEMANDLEIKNIRASLEKLLQSAKDNKLEDLPKLGAELKSSFIKVYLKRG